MDEAVAGAAASLSPQGSAQLGGRGAAASGPGGDPGCAGQGWCSCRVPLGCTRI